MSDGARGGDGRLDVYLVDLTGTGILGYATTDPGQADPHSKSGYMVMDEDYSDQADAAGVLQVTAAHEYNHILQFAYDAAQDSWMFESTAVWMEDLVYDGVDHYLGFIPSWATLDEIPLARNFQDKHYGSGVWNMWLDARHGPVLIRSAWQGSSAAAITSFAPAAYDAALLGGGHEGFSASFGRFSAAVAEWRTASQFPEGAAYTDAQRRGNLAVSASVRPQLDHTTYAMYTVPQPAGGWPAVLRLDGELPAGVSGALALVGRTGADPLAGAVTTELQQLPAGGAGSIQLENPAAFGRVTAVLVNADTDVTGFANGDWVFAADAQPFGAAAAPSASTASPPVNTARRWSPAPARRQHAERNHRRLERLRADGLRAPVAPLRHRGRELRGHRRSDGADLRPHRGRRRHATAREGHGHEHGVDRSRGVGARPRRSSRSSLRT